MLPKKLSPKEQKLLQEYEQNISLYRQFSTFINSELKMLLKKNKVFYQVTQRRVKSKKSLIPKLSNVKKLEKIDDIVACRVIFYLESDVKSFSNILFNHFKIVNPEKDYKLKYSEDGYNALHLIVQLNEQNTDKSTFSKFTGLKSEIQLTTVLFHSWSEIEHDVIYKPEEKIKNFDEKAFESLEKTFSDVMKNYLKEASYRFEFIYKKLEELKQGVKIFDSKNIQKILKFNSNNDIHEHLVLLKNYVQKLGDKVSDKMGMLNFIRKVIKKSISIKKVDPILDIYPSYTSGDVIIVCLDILNYVRYKYFIDVFNLLVEILSIPEEKVKNKVYEVAIKMTSFDKVVLDKVGFRFQFLILDELKSWNDKKLRENSSLVIKMLKYLFYIKFDSEELVTHDSLKIIKHTFTSTDGLNVLRTKSIEILKKLFELSDDKTKIEILELFREIGRKRHVDTNYKTIPDSPLNEMVKDDLLSIIELYEENYSKLNFALISVIEEQLEDFELWFPN